MRRFASTVFTTAFVVPGLLAITLATTSARADDDVVPGEHASPPPSPKDVPPPAEGADPTAIPPQEGTDSSNMGCDHCGKGGEGGEGKDDCDGDGCDREAHGDGMHGVHDGKHGMHDGESGVVSGYAGNFYLRDAKDRFLLMPAGRMQIDSYGYLGPGVEDFQRANGTGLKGNVQLKRLRLELAGRIMKHFYFWIGAEFGGGQPLDDNQKPTAIANAADAFLGYEACPWLRVQVGQFDLPFTMENVTSDKWLTFMERSLTVRAVGAPYNKDLGIMIRGEAPSGFVNYAIAAVGGDGQNRPSVDNRIDVAGRLFVRPLAGTKGDFAHVHLGLSGRWGRRDPTYVRYDAQGLSTPGGYSFWSPTYSDGNAAKLGVTHVIPSHDQRAAAFELYAPIGRFEFAAEAVLIHEERRESYGNTLAAIERAGTLTGTSWYVQLSFWPFGEPRVQGELGKYPDPKLAPGPVKAKSGLQLSARYEQVRLEYDSVARSFDGDTLRPGVHMGGLDAKTTSIKVDAVQLGATYWATKHVRLTAMWSMYGFPGGVEENQALAPGAKGTSKDPDARVLHEISARFAVAL